MDDVHSFEECCELTKEAQLLEPDRGIIRFSYNGHKYVNSLLPRIVFFILIKMIVIFKMNMDVFFFLFRCFFKCGGTQDFRGGDFWSSAEDISTCACTGMQPVLDY